MPSKDTEVCFFISLKYTRNTMYMYMTFAKIFLKTQAANFSKGNQLGPPEIDHSKR